jgi:hypothetical protein
MFHSIALTSWVSAVICFANQSKIFRQLAIQRIATIDPSKKTRKEDRTQYERDKPEIPIMLQIN